MAGNVEKIRVLIVDDIVETRENIRKLLQFEPDIDVVAMARTGKEAIQLAKETKPNVILMDINMPDMDGIAATRIIARDMPAAQIVMVSVQQDTDYLRQAMLAGARDFLSKPPSADELINTIRRLGEMSRAAEEKEKRVVMPETPGGGPGGKRAGSLDGKIVAVFSPKGGVGCTTLATNLAVALQSDDSKVVVVDANIQFGDVHVFFSLKSKYSLVSLVAQAEEVDEGFLQNVLTAHASGVKVLLGPPTPEDAELVLAPQLRKVLEALRHYFHYVVVDTASVLREQELAVLDIADRILLVAAPDLPTLANVKKFFDLSEKLEYPKDKIMLVLNRVDKRLAIPSQAIEDNLKHPIKAQIPFDDRAVVTSVNNGVPFVVSGKGTPPAQAVAELAQKVKEEFAPKEAAQPEKKPVAKPRSLFDRR
ncbi:MAG: response regulator [Anaerolineales bacterium]|nr:response regulator [Anaerolineales bacterium]